MYRSIFYHREKIYDCCGRTTSVGSAWVWLMVLRRVGSCDDSSAWFDVGGYQEDERGMKYVDTACQGTDGKGRGVGKRWAVGSVSLLFAGACVRARVCMCVFFFVF